MSAYDQGRDHAQKGGGYSNPYKNGPWQQRERWDAGYKQNKN